MPLNPNLGHFGKLMRVFMERRDMNVVKLAAASTLEDTFIVALQSDEEPYPSELDVERIIQGLSSVRGVTVESQKLLRLVAQCERDHCEMPKATMKKLERLYASCKNLNALAAAT